MDECMIDRLLRVALNTVIMGLISGASAGALVCAHWGVLRLLSGLVGEGTRYLAGAAALSLTSFFLIRNRNELVDR